MTAEYIAQMGPMWATAGLMVAWLANAFWRVGGHGFLTDMTLGLVGGLAAGALIRTAVTSNTGMLAMFAIGGGGALVIIAAQRGVWRPAPLRSPASFESPLSGRGK